MNPYEVKGQFPSSYVEVMGEESPVRPATLKPNRTESHLTQQRVKALYDYQATIPEELSIKEGDVITVLDTSDGDWWIGELKDGKKGSFPANYVESLY